MLTVLVVRGATLPGAVQGIKYFFYPNWRQLASPEVSICTNNFVIGLISVDLLDFLPRR